MNTIQHISQEKLKEAVRYVQEQIGEALKLHKQ